MNRISASFLLLFGVASILCGQGINIGSGMTFSLGGATLSLPNNWTNAGTFNAGTGTVIFNGASGNQTLTNVSGEIFQNLTINKAAGNVVLDNNIVVNGALTTASGSIDLNGQSITLGASALLSETPGNTVKGTSGVVTTTRTLGSSPGNVAGLGLDISSTAVPLGSTTISRGHGPQTGGGHYGMLRYYDISPATNSSLNATIIFNYDDSELNGLTESMLEGYTSINGGSTWSLTTGALNTSGNTYTLTGINTLTRYTLASNAAPLPVELVSFLATTSSTRAVLSWRTATETNTFGFEIQRRMLPNDASFSATVVWQNVGFVKSGGTSSHPQDYSYTDNLTVSGHYSYRLKQIDNGGVYKYSQEKVISVDIPKVFALRQNYPNPFNPSTVISFDIPKETFVSLIVCNTLGQELVRLVNEDRPAGRFTVSFDARNLPSGLYISRLTAGGFSATKKMVLLK